MTAPDPPASPDPADLDAVVDAVVDALYTQPLDGFIAARDAAARQAVDTGDKLGAERVKRLPKPSVAAWVINHVVRERPDDVAALTAVGDELRAATQDRDRARIKALDHLRRERTESLVGAVRDAGEVDGRPVSAAVLDRLTETLTAAVMDADAGAAVRAGRLSRGLQHAGFGVVDEEGEEADLVALRPEAQETAAEAGAEPEPEPAAEPSTADDAERAVEETSAAVDALEARRDDVADRLRAADSAVGQAQDEVTRLDEELARLSAERDAASATLDEARTAADEARADLTAVEQELDEAEDQAAQARRRRRAARGR
ncbi:hypothetical protein GCM10010413_17600 [Promicromonospora sukumoe]|uniref:Uncharacterized protein n=1 Tax=Promicromonospora sukumoe TaxID=88382 RepID=A0A7W3PER1_9MICO|nr:hypothetical protein [Promicromonospora sukumoe]MBA8809021.1 hypothetical protein [Promicromonospora sukumoe]